MPAWLLKTSGDELRGPLKLMPTMRDLKSLLRDSKSQSFHFDRFRVLSAPGQLFSRVSHFSSPPRRWYGHGLHLSPAVKYMTQLGLQQPRSQTLVRWIDCRPSTWQQCAKVRYATWGSSSIYFMSLKTNANCQMLEWTLKSNSPKVHRKHAAGRLLLICWFCSLNVQHAY